MEGQVIWITGLSGSGKTTIGELLYQRFTENGIKPILLDGDVLREIFMDSDQMSRSYNRKERIILSRKYGLLCKSLSFQGFTVIIATVSMFNEIYSWNRVNLPNYFEVYLDVPLKELSRRDPKNIYKKFNCGALSNVAGLDLKVDQPQKAHLVVGFEEGQTKEQIVKIILKKLPLGKII